MLGSFGQLKRFGADRRGTIAIIFALTIFLVIITVGLAIDGARAYNTSGRVSSALDAAALAAAKMLDDESFSDADIRERAERFFAAHVNESVMAGLTLPTPTVRINRDTNEVEITVNVALATTFGQLAGINTFNFPRSSKVVYDQKRIELAMVLDITGSMCSPCDKIDGLKDAADDVVQTMLTNDTPYGYVRIGLVPLQRGGECGRLCRPGHGRQQHGRLHGGTFGRAGLHGCAGQRHCAAWYVFFCVERQLRLPSKYNLAAVGRQE